MIVIPLLIIIIFYGYYRKKKLDRDLENWKNELALQPDLEPTVTDFKDAIDLVRKDSELSERDKKEFIGELEKEILKIQG